jgi:hypothetical protein
MLFWVCVQADNIFESKKKLQVQLLKYSVVSICWEASG